jgi:16S rRNA (guanine966-N2)-methyltransferase
MGQVRIIGGKYRSRIIRFSDNILGLRPTLDRVRETLFNWLGQDLTGKKLLDLFAGSGVLGFEAISRNAAAVTMIEQNSQVIKDLIENQKLLNCEDLSIVKADGLKYLAKCECGFDVLFLDPPYKSGLLAKCLDIIYTRRAEMQGVLIYFECEKMPHTGDMSDKPNILNVVDLTRYTIIKEKKTTTLHYVLVRLSI